MEILNTLKWKHFHKNPKPKESSIYLNFIQLDLQALCVKYIQAKSEQLFVSKKGSIRGKFRTFLGTHSDYFQDKEAT